MKRRVQLPDFGTYFHTKSSSPIDFTSRIPPNLFHDLLFLSSYIRDARFRIERIRLRGKTLKIPMERDRWELYERLGQLESISSQLTINPVLSIVWETEGKRLRKGSLPRNREFSIRGVYLAESFWDDSDKGEIIFKGHGKRPFKLRLTVRDYFVVHLKDRTEKNPSTR
jgi:hypothetical protein